MQTASNQVPNVVPFASTSTKPRPTGSNPGNSRQNTGQPAVIERFRPFPTDALPRRIRRFVEAGARAIGCDASYLALPALTVLAASIGNTRCIRLKPGWTAKPILWVGIVGESGTAKTPAFSLIMRPIRNRQRKALEEHESATRRYLSDLACYESELAEWKEEGANGEAPKKPKEPKAKRCIVSDTTVEALAPILSDNPRGLLLACDELAGWFGSFDRYASGKGSKDAALWLSMHNGESIIVDRKSGQPKTIFVPQASVSVCGGIQPGILHRALGVQHRESGLAARMLLTCPPRKPKKWTEDGISPEAEAAFAQVIERLHELDWGEDDEGNHQPIVVDLTSDAKARWREFYDAHADQQAELVGELAAAWSKLEEYAARLALVIHFARWAANDPTLEDANVVDDASMQAGIRLVTWFKAEAQRVYAILNEDVEACGQRRLIEWIESKDGGVSARYVQQNYRPLKEPGMAEPALERLRAAGYGEWFSAPSGENGGRPSRIFRLIRPAAVNETASLPEENASFVDVDRAGADELQFTDDCWAEAS